MSVKKTALLITGILLELLCLGFFINEKAVTEYILSSLRWNVWHIGFLFYLSLFGGAICIGLGLSIETGAR